MTVTLINTDVIEWFSNWNTITDRYDLILFDPDAEMPCKDDCLDSAWWLSSYNATLLFFGKNSNTIIDLLCESEWLLRDIISIYKDGVKIGLVAVATSYPTGILDFPNLGRIDVDTKGADGHPTSKDASWLDAFLDTGRYSSVLDPFMGSAQWGVACNKRGIDYTGIEINPEYFAMAEKNLGVRN